MNPWGEVLIGLVILVGLVGIVVPVLPGLSLIVIAVLAWAFFEGDLLGWSVFGVIFGLGAAATVIKVMVPGRKLKESGVATSTLVIAVVCAVIGFFAIPVVGGPIGFVAGIYFIEWSRSGRENAWTATKQSAGAVALSIGIELSAGLVIGGIWLVAAILG